MQNQKIRVVYGDIKRESVLIDPNIPPMPISAPGGKETEQNNIIARGESTGQILKIKYGKR